MYLLVNKAKGIWIRKEERSIYLSENKSLAHFDGNGLI